MRQFLKTIRDAWQPHRDRVLWAPVFLGIGIAVYFALAREPLAGPSAGGLAAALLLCLAVARRYREWGYAAFCVFLVALGFNLGVWRSLTVAAPMLERTINITRIEGRIQNVSMADDERGRTRRRVILDSLVIDKLPPEKTPASVRLSTYHVPLDAVPGERAAMLARLMPPSGPVAPGGFDYRRQAFFEGTGAVGFTMGRYEKLAEAEEAGDVWFNRLRRDIAARVSAHMPHPESAVAVALLAGERSDIPESVNDDLRDSGLYHILSISGLHVAIVCGVAFFALRFVLALWPYLALRVPIKKIAAMAALLVGLFYCLLAGMPVPTQRSILMTGLVLLAVMLDRTALSIRTIALAAFFVLLLQPESLLGASFQLSFAAVLAMVAFHESWGRRFMIAGHDRPWFARLGVYFAGIAVTTIVVSIATMPPVLHHFGRIQIFGVIANAIAIPLTSFIVMPFGMAALMVMPLGLEGVFLKPVEWGVRWTLDIAHWVAHLPHAALSWPNLPLGWYIAAIAGFLWFCFWRGTVRWLGMPLMVASIALGLTVAERPVAMLDAEGRSLAVHGGGQTAYAGKTPTRFVRDNWKSVWGGVEAHGGKPVRDPVWQAGGTGMACDDWACRVTRGPAGMSVLRSANALYEECNWASIVIALDRAVGGRHREGCAAALITYWELRAGGGMALYSDGKTWRAEPMTPRGDRRPWTLRAGSRN